MLKSYESYSKVRWKKVIKKGQYVEKIDKEDKSGPLVTISVLCQKQIGSVANKHNKQSIFLSAFFMSCSAVNVKV